MDQYFIVTIILLFTALIILGFKYINKKSIISESSFVISMKILNTLIDDYCIFHLEAGIKKLKKNYDLDENSQTNAFNQFNQDYITLLNTTTRSIIHEYLSPTIKTELLIYFSIDSLILYIINQLQDKIK